MNPFAAILGGKRCMAIFAQMFKFRLPNGNFY